VNQRVDFVSKEDKTKPKTIFVLKPLSGLESLTLSKYVINGGLKITEDYVRDVLSKSVVEIKHPNLTEKEEIISFIEKQDVVVLMELSAEVLNIGTVTDDDKKK